jgi:hypothetical protein
MFPVHTHRKPVLLVDTHQMLGFLVLDRLTLVLPAFLWPLGVRTPADFHPSAGVHLLASGQYLSLTHPPPNSRFLTLNPASIMALISLFCLKLPMFLPTSCLRRPGLKFHTPHRSITTLVPSGRNTGPTFRRRLTIVLFPLIVTVFLILEAPARQDLRRSPLVCITTLSPLINNLNCSQYRLM